MPASTNYHVIEPHPSVPHTRCPAIHTARGGAGNVISLKNTKTTDSRNATGPPSLTHLDSNVPKTFKSGRGGAGNVHSSSERAIFSFDEELERELRRVAPVYHVGRGGAGNRIHTNSSSSSNSSNSSMSRMFSGSSSATGSSADLVSDRARDKAMRGLGKGWGKLRSMA